MVPKELMKYRGKERKDIPIDVAEKYEDMIYKVMAELIVQPTDKDGKQHNAEWWKENTGWEFVQVFQNHMLSIFDEMEKNIENF